MSAAASSFAQAADAWFRSDGTPIAEAGRIRRGPRALYESIRMSLISLIITIVVVGLLLWVINSFIPMESRVKSILNVVVIIILVLWLLQAFGIIGSLRNVRVGAADGAARSMQSDLACNDTSSSWQLLPSS